MEGWKEITLDNACLIKKGVQFNKTELEDSGSYPCINGGLQPSGYSEKWNTEADTITISEGGESCGYVNRISSRFWCGGHCYSLLQINEKINKDFFYFALKCRENSIMDLRVGSGLPNIQQKALKAFDFIYPISDIEQKKIAQILTALDDTIKQTEQLIAKYKNIKQGLKHDLLTYGIDENGTIRNPGTHTFVEKKGLMVPEEWEVDSLGSCFDNFKSGNNITAENIFNIAHYPVYGGNGLRGYTNNYTHSGKYVLIGRQGALCGNINVVTGENYISEHAIAVQTNTRNDIDYWYYKLDYMNLNQYSAQSAQPGLAVEKLIKLIVNIPKRTEQEKIAEILNKQDSLIESEQTNLSKLQKLKQGLMADLLTGKVKVKTESV